MSALPITEPGAVPHPGLLPIPRTSSHTLTTHSSPHLAPLNPELLKLKPRLTCFPATGDGDWELISDAAGSPSADPNGAAGGGLLFLGQPCACLVKWDIGRGDCGAYTCCSDCL